jgi:glycine/D-amino acid oxidase-like deaminating enzyme
MDQERVTIIGGGLVGIATALSVKSRCPGAKVLILEKNDAVALENSYQNLPLQSYIDALPRLSAVKLLTKGLWDSSSRLSVQPASCFSLQFVKWSVLQMLSCRPSISASLSDSLFFLALRNAQISSQLSSQAEQGRPLLSVYGSVAELEQARDNATRWNSMFSQQFQTHYSRANCLKTEPFVSEVQAQVVGCIENKAETPGVLDVYQYSLELHSAALAKGVQLLCNAEVVAFNKVDDQVASVTLKDGREISSDYFIICSGQKSASLSYLLGWRAPVCQVKTSTLSVALQSPFLHSLYLDDLGVSAHFSSRRAVVGPTVEITNDQSYSVGEG